jgi:pimeloyl-ACP methyl ester carboxylesterase
MKDAAPFLDNRNAETEQLVRPLLTLDGIKLELRRSASLAPPRSFPSVPSGIINGAKDPQTINPDTYNNALHYLSRPGQEAIQLDLLYNYRTNLSEYPKWQQWLKTTQPRMLLVWGKNDVFFPVSAAEAIKRDVPSAELHVYDTSHLALEEHHEDIAQNIISFLSKK